MKYLFIILLLFTGCATVRPWTNSEKMILGASCLAVAADMYTTLDGLHDGNYEINPIMGKYPSDGTVISIMALTQVTTIVLAHYFPDFRTWILGIKTGINAGFAFHNIRTDQIIKKRRKRHEYQHSSN